MQEKKQILSYFQENTSQFLFRAFQYEFLRFNKSIRILWSKILAVPNVIYSSTVLVLYTYEKKCFSEVDLLLHVTVAEWPSLKLRQNSPQFKNGRAHQIGPPLVTHFLQISSPFIGYSCPRARSSSLYFHESWQDKRFVGLIWRLNIWLEGSVQFVLLYTPHFFVDI